MIDELFDYSDPRSLVYGLNAINADPSAPPLTARELEEAVRAVRNSKLRLAPLVDEALQSFDNSIIIRVCCTIVQSAIFLSRAPHGQASTLENDPVAIKYMRTMFHRYVLDVSRILPSELEQVHMFLMKFYESYHSAERQRRRQRMENAMWDRAMSLFEATDIKTHIYSTYSYLCYRSSGNKVTNESRCLYGTLPEQLIHQPHFPLFPTWRVIDIILRQFAYIYETGNKLQWEKMVRALGDLFGLIWTKDNPFPDDSMRVFERMRHCNLEQFMQLCEETESFILTNALLFHLINLGQAACNESYTPLPWQTERSYRSDGMTFQEIERQRHEMLSIVEHYAPNWAWTIRHTKPQTVIDFSFSQQHQDSLSSASSLTPNPVMMQRLAIDREMESYFSNRVYLQFLSRQYAIDLSRIELEYFVKRTIKYAVPYYQTYMPVLFNYAAVVSNMGADASPDAADKSKNVANFIKLYITTQMSVIMFYKTALQWHTQLETQARNQHRQDMYRRREEGEHILTNIAGVRFPLYTRHGALSRAMSTSEDDSS